MKVEIQNIIDRDSKWSLKVILQDNKTKSGTVAGRQPAATNPFRLIVAFPDLAGSWKTATTPTNV